MNTFCYIMGFIGVILLFSRPKKPKKSLDEIWKELNMDEVLKK